MKTAAAAIDNATFKNAVENHCTAIKMQAALKKTMDTFKKPSNVDFCTSGS